MEASTNYTQDIHHWSDTSTQTPVCVLEAGSANDVAVAIKIIGATKTPFAVKSGGHASNPGFSSTTGVHIVLNRLSQVNLSHDRTVVELGMGQTWLDVYRALEPTGINVVGGRVPGPGVGGSTLGGGYSWKTNQFGLSCDTVKSYTLVQPCGEIVRVSERDHADLFFALKGGLNRFGIVTSTEFETHPQASVVTGGIRLYSSNQTQLLIDATAKFFEQNTDVKAQVIPTLQGGAQGTSVIAIFLYDSDGPVPESLKLFDGIPTVLDTVQQQTFADFVGGIPDLLAVTPRGTFNTISTSKLTPSFLAAVKNQSDYYGAFMPLQGGVRVGYDIEPFDPSYGRFSTDSAYPHAQSPLPINLDFAWTLPSQDAFWYAALHDSVNVLKQAAIREGIYNDAYTKYPNYAITGSTAEELYGSKNAQRLREIRKRVDPDSVMNLAGGFHL
ncbi:MAG: hypothetical protein Q9159_005460 [Coniocarpon cinnabarinum]